MAWNRPSEEAPLAILKHTKRGKKIAWLVISVLLVGCAAIGCKIWIAHGWAARSNAQHASKTIPAIAPRLASTNSLAQSSSEKSSKETASNSGGAFENEYVKMFPDEKIERVQTNKTGYIEVHGIKLDGTRTVHIVEPPSIFKHPTDEIILFAINSPAGKPIPPLPNLGGKRSDVAFMKALSDPILDSASDSAKVRAYKDMVRTARQEIKKRMDAGESFSNIINDHVNMMNENTNLRAKAQKELKEYIAKGDTEGARVYYKVINGQFNKMGIPPLKLSEKNSFIAKEPKQ